MLKRQEQEPGKFTGLPSPSQSRLLGKVLQMVTVSGPLFWLLFLFLGMIIWKEQLTGSRVCLGSQFEGVHLSWRDSLKGYNPSWQDCVASHIVSTARDQWLKKKWAWAMEPQVHPQLSNPPTRPSLLKVLQPSQQLQQLGSTGSDMLVCGGHFTSKSHQTECPLSKMLKTGMFYIFNLIFIFEDIWSL